LGEIALIFAVFALAGSWPVPDVNEPHYLGKVIHYWNPDWLRGDFFMESVDTHKVFYFTFGWLSLWLCPTALAWTGRVATWFLLAWSWRRLSVAAVPIAWCSVLTAAVFACLMDRCHMAGEWVIGGVEAKGFAYVFVFLGLEALLRNRWNRALILMGAAAAFHVLVGGWGAVATGVAWLLKPAPPLRSLWPGILLGFCCALPGLVPSLTVDWGADPRVTDQAHQIYVFERLPHHLVLTGIRPEFIVRLGLLWLFWLLLGRWSKRSDLADADRPSLSRLRAFVTGAVVITLVGAALHLLIPLDRSLAATLLRYYWFRLTDVALPLGVALEGVALLAALAVKRPAVGKLGFAMVVFGAALHLGYLGVARAFPAPPRSHRIADFEAWRDACRWIDNAGEVPADARFITPRLTQTLKWYTGRSDVATWKDVPQNAGAIVEWWTRIEDLYATGQPPPAPRWYDPITLRGAKQLRRLGAKYGADYLITRTTNPPLDLTMIYRNRSYAIYRLR
jgi:hypothetical protein